MKTEILDTLHILAFASIPLRFVNPSSIYILLARMLFLVAVCACVFSTTLSANPQICESAALVFPVCRVADCRILDSKTSDTSIPNSPISGSNAIATIAPVNFRPLPSSLALAAPNTANPCPGKFSSHPNPGQTRTDVSTNQAAALPAKTNSDPIPEHRFWDRQNDLLFVAVGASRALDYASTLNFRRRGRNEVFLTNEIVDNHPAFAAIEAASTAASIGASYLFHRYHHHRLERWTSVIHASLATSGAIRNYSLKTAH